MIVLLLSGWAGEALAQISITGSLATQYRFRTDGDDSDQDIYQYLDLNVGDPIADRVTFHLLARGTLDVEGNNNSDDYYVFDSISDTYNRSYDGKLFHAYLDFHNLEGLSVLRIGRQILYDAPVTLYFDGGRLETSPLKDFLSLQLGIYGGLPTHLYEPEPAGNAMYGAYLNSKPWTGARMQLHWTHVDNEYLYGTQNNNLYSLSYWQSITQYFRFNAVYTRIDDKNRDAMASATVYVPEWDLIVQARYYELLETQKYYAIDFDPFYAPLYENYPYWQAGVMVYKGLGDNFAVEGGFEGRKLKDEKDEGIFNHAFNRYYGTFIVRDLGLEGLEMSATGSVFDSDTRNEDIHSYSGDVTYRANRSFKVSGGVDYSLYRYDYYLNSELEDFYTYYFKVRYYPSPPWRLDLGYEYEDGRNDDYQWFKLGVAYEFGANDEQ